MGSAPVCVCRGLTLSAGSHKSQEVSIMEGKGYKVDAVESWFSLALIVTRQTWRVFGISEILHQAREARSKYEGGQTK